MSKGALLVDHTTASGRGRPRDGRHGARERPALPRCAGLGRRGGAKNGALTVMVGGDQKSFDDAKPVMGLLRPCRHPCSGRRARGSSPRWSTRSASPAASRACRKASRSA
ncbi:MAG: NAD(P)-binding domain-containing protein [Pseudomonadota bacterium]